MRILLVSGSLRAGSLNTQLARQAQALLAGRARTSLLSYGDVPLFSQDLEQPVLPAVEKARDAFVQADGVWFFTPEYNGQLPGVLKNLLDWMSRPFSARSSWQQTALWGRIAIISGIGGKNATAGSRKQLEDLLHFVHMDVVADSQGFAMSPEEMKTSQLNVTEAMKTALAGQADALLEAIRKQQQ